MSEQPVGSAAASRGGVVKQIPRNALALLMVAQLAALLPHLRHQSLWIVGVGLFCGYWRTQVHRGRFGYPGAWVKAGLVLGAVAVVLVSGTPIVSLESATALMLLAFALKLLEMKTQRDAYLVIFLCYFVIATQFLFDQALWLAVYEVLAVVIVTAALIGMNQVQTAVRPGRSLRIAGTLIAQALPLTVVLFLFFPRIAPLWSMPLPSGVKTGISDSMTPGDVAQLTRSDKLAFRAQFSGRLPRYRDLYWRGLVLENFENGTWSTGARQEAREVQGRRQARAALRQAVSARSNASANRIDYDLLQEPTGSDWLFALATAVPRQSNISVTGQYTLRAQEPVLSVAHFRISSYPELLVEPARLDEYTAARATRLPGAESPRMREFARVMFAAADQDVTRFIARFNEHITRQPFFYTLSPAQLANRDSIDQFWFQTRSGFCSHYAGALVFALRTVNVPSRMVVGYQGGSINPLTGHLEVRQYDAHAWVEAWVRGRGWIRIDPTAAVAPQRIEQGLGAALSAEDRSALSLFASARLSEGSMLSAALDFVDSIEHRWNLWVVGFDSSQQRGLLQELLGKVTPARIGLAMLIAGGLSLALVALLLFWRQRPRHRNPVARAFLALAATGSALGVPKQAAESPGAYLQRLAAVRGLDRPAIALLERQLTTGLYDAPDAALPRTERRIVRALRRLRLRLRLPLPRRKGLAAADA